MSDIHIGPSDASNSRCINTRETPRRMLTDPETVNVPDVVVAVSGDADDDGSVEAYTAARRMVRESALRNRAAVAFCTGNHDERGTFAQVPGSGHRGAEGPPDHGTGTERASARGSPLGLTPPSTDTSVKRPKAHSCTSELTRPHHNWSPRSFAPSRTTDHQGPAAPRRVSLTPTPD
ncbi:hypothetical protein ACFZBE_28145 [Streptomyces sp. NPDC008061]|uniref:hypothetical protein n=1 Tax=Streptomyces sp. NPDC008061 TaxID=3364805 RepID=UPI0036E95AB3